MTIPANNRNDAVGNDLVSNYEYGFKIFAATHLEVKVKRTSDGSVTTLAYPTHYAVTNVGKAAGGFVDLESVGGAWQNADGTLKTGYTISIARVVPIVQATDIKNQGDFFAVTHEDAFDYQMMVNQAQGDAIDRSVRLDSAYDPDAFDMTLPAPIAGGAIGFNATADGLAIISDLGGAPTTAFTLTLLDDANADAFWATLAAGMTDWDTVWADIVDGIIDLDVAVQKLFDGMTALGTEPAAGDKLFLSDISLTPDEARAVTMQEAMGVVGDLTEDTAPDRDNDYMLSFDASAAAGSKAKKVPFKASKITTLVRQTVLASALTSAGYANAITTGSGLRPGLSATATPIVMTFANGHDAYGAVDYCERIADDASDILGADLPTSNTSYIYRTMGSAWGSCLVAPQYGYAFDRTQGALLNFEGSDTSTSMIDDFGNTWTASGNAQIDTAQFKFGSSSLLLDGTGDYIESTNFTSLGDGSWEASVWVRWNSLPTAAQLSNIFALENASGFGVVVTLYNNAGTTRTRVDLSSNGTTNDIVANDAGSSTTWAANTWYRFRMVFDALAGTYRLYVSNNGAAESQESTTSSTSRICAVTKFRIGRTAQAGYIDFNGWIDGFRFIRAATATGTQTPSASAPTITDYPVHFFSIPGMKMYEVTTASGTAGVNPTLTARNRLFVAEADTSGAAVTAVRNYALRGRYSAVHAVTASTPVNFNHNIGTDLVNMNMQGTRYSSDGTAWPAVNSGSWTPMWAGYYYNGASNQLIGTGYALKRATGILWPGFNGIFGLGDDGAAFNITHIRTSIERAF